MLARKTGKPAALEEEDEISDRPQEETLDQFLRNMHGETTTSTSAEEQAKAADDPTKLPGLGWLREHFKTKSATIRYLTIERKFPIKDVAKHLGIKYQHVRNVTRQQLKRGPNESFHLADGQAVKSVETPEYDESEDETEE